jgi:hypothetical protein
VWAQGHVADDGDQARGLSSARSRDDRLPDVERGPRLQRLRGRVERGPVTVEQVQCPPRVFQDSRGVLAQGGECGELDPELSLDRRSVLGLE